MLHNIAALFVAGRAKVNLIVRCVLMLHNIAALFIAGREKVN
jgi:hypothetical protein